MVDTTRSDERGPWRQRIDEAFGREQLRSYGLAVRVMLVVLPVITLWVTIENGVRDALFFYPYIGLLAALLFVPYVLRRTGREALWLDYLLAPLYAGLIAYLGVAQPPSDSVDYPLPLFLTFGNEVYLYVIVAASVFTFRPRLVLWTGVATAAAWSMVTVRALLQPDSIGDIPNDVWAALAPAEQIRLASDPHRVHVGKWVRQVVTLLVVSGMLAAFVRMCRGLVFRQAAAERERANLSRYFSSNLVDELAQTDEPLGPTRSQDVAVLFADIVGFTALSEQRQPADVIALLREFHGRMERAVFAHDGTVDKYIGDAVMATFGTPATRDDDAVRALRCARTMVDSVDEWNRERARRGESAIRMGVGIHFGPVVLGDIGGEQRLEFAVIGDTVNVASRLERLTRTLQTRIVISGALLAAVRQRGGESAPELSEFTAAGEHSLRGRDAGIDAWCWG
jgi:adenylate cyclase